VRASLLVAFALFFLYATGAAALQGVLAAPRQLGEWTPDLGLMLLFAWAGRLPEGRGPLAALLAALARAGLGADPPLALAAGFLGAFGLFALLRTGLEIDRALPRALLCGLCAWLSARLLIGARTLALAAEAPAVSIDAVSIDDVRLWPGALASAVACLLLAPLCLRLPGLVPFARKRA
jgi:hypothetical protein